jgi:hypothetical protein
MAAQLKFVGLLATFLGAVFALSAATALIPGATSSAADPSFQPTAPIAASFFYPWFPNAWTQGGGIYPYTRYEPTAGYYSSIDDAVIDQQLTLAKRAHLEAFISSWWGQGHQTDTALQHIIARSERIDSPNPDMRWAVYYEPEGYSDPTATQILADLNYLSTNFFGHQGFLRISGKPVVFVWASGSDLCGMADRWAQAKSQFGGNVHIVLKVFSGYASCASQPDSWHQYAPASGLHQHLPNSAVVSPGFWHAAEASPRLIRDPVRFEADVQTMAATSATWHLVTTWNEWGEGTGIEPTTQFADEYIEILCRNLPGATPCDSVLVGAGDIASCTTGDSEATAALLDDIAGWVFVAGDLAYESGTAAQFTDCYGPSWGRHKDRTKPAPGNHEYVTSGASGYYGYFGDIASPDQPGCVSGCRGYYAYNLGSWRVYSLNSHANKTAELTWLQADLAANPRTCSVAYYHHPILSAGPHDSDDAGGGLPIWQALWDAGVDLVVAGHDHNYQRYAPLNRTASAVDSAGMRQIIAGTGGRGITTATRTSSTPGLQVWQDGSTASAFGVLKLTLHTGSYDWQFVPVAGETFSDSGNQACDAAGADTDGDGLVDLSDNCPTVANTAQADADGDNIGNACDSGDSDGDFLVDTTEYFCGSPANDGSKRPERVDLAGDDDGDTLVNEVLPVGAANYDCDGDGYGGSSEDRIFAGAGGRDQDACGNNGWPSDLLDSNLVNVGDLSSFLTPVRVNPDGHGSYNKFNHPLDDTAPAGSDTAMLRWNLQNSPADGPATLINIADLTSLLIGDVGSPARPPMFGGQQVFFTNGGQCPWPP